MGYTDKLKRQEKRLTKRIKRREGKGKSTEKAENKLKQVQFKSAVNNLFSEVTNVNVKKIKTETIKKAMPQGYFGPEMSLPLPSNTETNPLKKSGNPLYKYGCVKGKK